MADSLYAIKTLVYDEQKLSMADLRDALANNFGKLHAPEEAEEITKNLAKAFVADGVSLTEEQVRTMYQTALTGGVPEDKRLQYEAIRNMLEEVPKFGNDLPVNNWIVLSLPSLRSERN